MRLWHLADLHLGKVLNGRSLLEDQSFILRQILERAAEEKPDLLLLAGDLYDKRVPPIEAVTLFDSFLTEAAELEIKVALIPGNHDSAERLSFGARLLRSRKIFLSSGLDSLFDCFELEDEFGPLELCLIPFFNLAKLRGKAGCEDLKTTAEGAKRLLDEIGQSSISRRICLAHQFVLPAGNTVELSDSESAYVGTLDAIPAEIFAAFNYTALGHLHRPQRVLPRVVYAGSPLAYSASEAGEQKSIVDIRIAADGSCEIDTIPLKPLRALRCLKGPWSELLSEAISDEAREDYIYVELSDESMPVDAVRKLRALYPNLMQLRLSARQAGITTSELQREELERPDPTALFERFFISESGHLLSERQRADFAEILSEIFTSEARPVTGITESEEHT